MKFERYPTRTIKNYFPTPNEIFTLGLCPEEGWIYSYLLRCENENFQCWPSYKTICENVNIKSKNTVKKYIDSLCEKQLIWTEPTQIYRGDLKVNGNIKYTVRPIYEAIQYRLKQQFKENDERIEQECLEKILKKREAEAKNVGVYGQVS